jgi:hypothetical protein
MSNLNNNKNLGYLFGFVFLILSVLNLNNIYLFLLLFLLGIFFLYVAKIKPENLLYLTKMWLGLGEILAKMFSPIILLFLFIFLFLPIGLLIQFSNLIFSKKKTNTYWKEAINKTTNLKKQF